MGAFAASLVMNKVAQVVTIACVLWAFSYMLLGGFEPGRTWFTKVTPATHHKEVIVWCLAVPLLLAGSVAAIFVTAPPRLSTQQSGSCSRRNLQRHGPVRAALLSCLSAITCPTRKNGVTPTLRKRPERNLRYLAAALILVPSIVYLVGKNYEHFHPTNHDNHSHDAHRSKSHVLGFVGNTIGVVAFLGGSYLLIPVASSGHVPLLRSIGLFTPSNTVQLHIWAGGIFIWGGFLHGLCYIVRWKFLDQQSLLEMLIPPAPCWTMNIEQYQTPQCTSASNESSNNHDYKECSCYNRFRNLTGLVSVTAMILIAITSLRWFREKFYRIFYLCHILASPLAIITLVMHWNEAILFLCPSLIFYAATSIPQFLEKYIESKRSESSIKVLAVEKIGPETEISNHDVIPHLNRAGNSNISSSYVSITLEATDEAIRKFRPGYYVQLHAPRVSCISHPFTINVVPGRSNHLRIIFKVTGAFTSHLSRDLLLSSQTKTGNPQEQQQQSTTDADGVSCFNNVSPPLYMRGYYGTPDRVEQVLQHDHVLIIAGGIGVAPFLSLLHQVYDAILLQNTLDQLTMLTLEGDKAVSHAGISTETTDSYTCPLKHITLIWTCREVELIDYIEREYLRPLAEKVASARRTGNTGTVCRFEFVIHCTGNADTTTSNSASLGTVNAPHQSNPKECSSSCQDTKGIAFNPSTSIPGIGIHWTDNVLSFASFGTIVWSSLAFTMWIYRNHTDKHQVLSRLWAPLAQLTISVAVAVLVQILIVCLKHWGVSLVLRQTEPVSGVEMATAIIDATRTCKRQRSDKQKGKYCLVDPTDASEEHQEKSWVMTSNAEMESIQPSDEEIADNGGSSEMMDIGITKKQGRISVDKMFHYIEGASCPGVFTCGPKSLSDSVREQIEKESSFHRRFSCESFQSRQPFALYEEAFEM